MTQDTQDETSAETQLGWDCPNCGELNGFEPGVEPEDIQGRVYSCTGCGENTLMRDYVGDKHE